MASHPTESPSLRLATISDLSAIARCWYHTFFNDEIIGEMMHPNRDKYPEDVHSFLLRGIRERFFDWRHQFIVVTVKEDGNEKIVGAADWRRVGDGGRRMELWWFDPRTLIAPTMRLYNRLSLVMFPNRAADPARTSFLTHAVSNAGKYWTGDHAECWDLYTCGVHPEFQRVGVGKMLVAWGIDRSDKEGVSTSVLCGEKNRRFYANGGLNELVGNGKNGIALFRTAVGAR